MGAGASASGGDPTEADLLKKINGGGMDQAMALEFVVKSTIENPNMKLTEQNAALLKAVIGIAAKSEGPVRVYACCIIRNMSVDKNNKEPLCEKSLGLFRALEHVMFEDSGNARVHATCVLQNLATVDANRVLMTDPELKLIEALVYTIQIDDGGAREHACATIWNIVCNKTCRDVVAASRVYVVLASALNGDHAACRMNAAGALWNFSCVSRNRDLMRRVNDENHKLFEGLVSMLHADHGVGAAKACGTIWNLILDDRCAQFFSAKELGLLGLLKRIVKREPAGKLRYYACGCLRSLSRFHVSKEQLFTPDNVDLFTAYGAVLRETLTEMCHQHANINHHHESRESRPQKLVEGADGGRKEKRQSHHGHGHRHRHGHGHGHGHHDKTKDKDSDNRSHHHSLPHISESMDTVEQICNALVNLSMIPTPHSNNRQHHREGSSSGHSSAREVGSGQTSARDSLVGGSADFSGHARMTISDPAHGIVSVLSELLHYACSFSAGKDISIEYIVLCQLISVTIVGISSTSNSVVIKRMLDSQLHVACLDILKLMFAESKAVALQNMTKSEDIVPPMWKQGACGEGEEAEGKEAEAEGDRHYFIAKIGNYMLNYLLNLAKHYYITATAMKHSHTIFPILMECTWTEDDIISREELRRKKASKDEHKEFTVKGVQTFQQREAQKNAEDAETRAAEKMLQNKVTNYNYAEGIKISLLVALLYGRDNEQHEVVIGKNESIIGSVSTASVPPDDMDVHITGFEFCHGRILNVMTNILSAARHLLRHHHSHHAPPSVGTAVATKGGHRPTLLKIQVNTIVAVEHVETEREHIVFRFGSPAFSTVLSGICSLCCSDYSKDELRCDDARFTMEEPPVEGSEARRLKARAAPHAPSLDSFNESDYATMSMLAQLYQLLEKVLHIYVHHHHATYSSDEFSIVRTAISALQQLAAVHGPHGRLDRCSAVGRYHRRLVHNYSIDIPSLLEELLHLLTSDCEAVHGDPTEQTRRNLECIVQVQILLSKIRYKDPVVTDEDAPKAAPKAVGGLDEAVAQTHIMTCFCAPPHTPIEELSGFQQQAEGFTAQLRTLGFDVWSALEGSDILPALYTSVFRDIMATRNSPRLSALMAPPVATAPPMLDYTGVERHLSAVVAASSIFVIFVSSECHDSVYCQIECDLIRRHLLGSGRPEGGGSIRTKPAVLFVSLQSGYLRVVPTHPTFDYGWLNVFAAEFNKDYNLLQIAEEPVFARRSRSTLESKDSFISRVPEASESPSIPFLRYYSLMDMGDLVKELSYIIQQHSHTIASNKPKVAAELVDDHLVDDQAPVEDETPKGDYAGAWAFITDVNHVIDIDDTMADLSELGIDHPEDLEMMISKPNADQLSQGLKSVFRKDFMALLGYASPRS
mgnify:FL=1